MIRAPVAARARQLLKEAREEFESPPLRLTETRTSKEK